MLVTSYLLALLLLSGGWHRAEGRPASHDRGRTIAERECSRCHAVSAVGASPNAEAPAFRELSKRYPVEQLAEALAEGIVVGHNDMPEFQFEPDDIEALLAYIASLGP